jgi:hypothetical protein
MNIARRLFRTALFACLGLGLVTLAATYPADAGQVWTKCHFSCRCLKNNQVGNFEFAVPVDGHRDMGADADQACRAHGYRICLDACNGHQFTYTYQVTSP